MTNPMRRSVCVVSTLIAFSVVGQAERLISPCELLRQPQRYHGRKVAIRGVVSQGFEWFHLAPAEPGCGFPVNVNGVKFSSAIGLRFEPEQSPSRSGFPLQRLSWPVARPDQDVEATLVGQFSVTDAFNFALRSPSLPDGGSGNVGQLGSVGQLVFWMFKNVRVVRSYSMSVCEVARRAQDLAGRPVVARGRWSTGIGGGLLVAGDCQHPSRGAPTEQLAIWVSRSSFKEAALFDALTNYGPPGSDLIVTLKGTLKLLSLPDASRSGPARIVGYLSDCDPGRPEVIAAAKAK